MNYCCYHMKLRSETFLRKSGAVLTGYYCDASLRCLDIYVTLYKTFYNLLVEQVQAD